MSCEFCGKKVKKGEEFILVGKYPSWTKIGFISFGNSWTPPTMYGKIYHKACFLKLCEKEIAEKKE